MDTSEQCMTACKQSLKQNIFLLLSNSYLVFTLQVTSLGVNRRKTGKEGYNIEEHKPSTSFPFVSHKIKIFPCNHKLQQEMNCASVT